jgi:MprA protease rhombosortase-interaction domain-containing protein
MRRQLLIAESELNRGQLVEEWRTMTHGVSDLAHRAKTIAAWGSSAALLAAGLAAFGQRKSGAAGGRHSWFQRMIKGVRLARSIWMAYQGRSE